MYVFLVGEMDCGIRCLDIECFSDDGQRQRPQSQNIHPQSLNFHSLLALAAIVATFWVEQLNSY